MSLAKRMMLSVALTAATAATALAVPAKPTPVQVTQPDGTVITIQLRGDERSHFILTEDNYLVIEKDGAYHYGNADSQGNLVASQLLVSPKTLRSDAEKAFLQSVDMNRVFHVLEKKSAETTLARREAAANGPQRAVSTNTDGIGLFPGTHFPETGDQKGLVVLVEYTDTKFTLTDPYDYFYRMLNEPNFSSYGGTGSARDYFLHNSKNQFRPEFDVYGPITLAHNMSYYGGNDWWGNDQNPEQMAIEACQQLDAEVDFSQYDRDGDGYIDNVFVFYAGRGEASGGSANTVWPHSWEVSAATSTPYYFDGVRLDRYACSNEWESGEPDGVGTFIHEFSHVMGIPDLYATSYTSAFTPGAFSAMDYGPYNNDGRTPPNYSIFERYALGWIQPTIIDGPLNGRLTRIEQSNQGYIIPTTKDNEFFLLENRQNQNWDAYIPGHGMLIWHIDYNTSVWNSNTVNNDASHQYVDIEEADNSKSSYSQAGDPFPGTSNVTEFTDNTTPNMKMWNNTKLNLPITDIAESSTGVITFKVAGGRPAIDPVQTLEATDVTAISFTAHWTASELAVKYFLSVYTIDETITDPNKSNIRYVSGYGHLDVGNVTEYVVEGLYPETTYYYKVTAMDEYDEESEASNQTQVVTGAPTFDFLAPVATDGTEATPTGFTANWEPMDDATEYFLTVYTKDLKSYDTDTVDFADGLKLPAGWSTTSKLTYSMTSYCGQSAPALRMASVDASITSPTYQGDILKLAFWHRGSNAPEANSLVVYGLVGKQWSSVATIAINNAVGGETNEIEMPAGTRALRILYNRVEDKGSVALDDIVVDYNPVYDLCVVDGLDGISVGDATSYDIDGLDSETTYYYYITASNGEYTSQQSNEISITTQQINGMAPISVASSITVAGRDIIADDTLCVYTLDGRRVSNRGLTPGIYLARTSTQTRKVVIR